MKTLFERKTFEDEWFSDLRKPAGMSNREWSEFLLYLRSSRLNYLLHPRWAWGVWLFMLCTSTVRIIGEIGWDFPKLLTEGLSGLLPLILLGSFWIQLRLIDWHGKERLATTVLGRKYPRGLL